MAGISPSANGKMATIIGATGLIGSHLLVIDFTDLAAFKAAIAGSDAVFCAVGTTQKKVKGNKVAYRKVDGEVEDRVRTMDIRSITIFRPSMLLGKREESRPMETMAQVVMRPLSFLLSRNYKPIAAYDVARAMVAASKKETPGFHVYHYKEMMAL